MKKNLRYLAVAAVGAVVAFGFTSCAYDPYYSSSAGGSYSSGYGEGYGYGGSSFSTSLFVSTGDPRWGYDPNCYSYYDYSRNCYYDPYLNGYYPRGYRPPVVYGVPHPNGWHPGGGYMRPPGHVTNVTVNNYHDREGRYRNSSYGWAKQVRQQPRPQDQRSSQGSSGRNSNYQNPSQYNRQNTGARPQNYQQQNYQQQGQGRKPDYRQTMRETPGRTVTPYNTSVNHQQKDRQGPRPPQYQQQQGGRQPQQKPQHAEKPAKGKNKGDDDDNRVHGYR